MTSRCRRSAPTCASTNTLGVPTPSGLDSIATAAAYDRSATAPVNLDFEGLASFGGETTAWITQNAASIASAAPSSTLDDLEPLRAMVGSAHVVGLGDATYGMRESLQLKHRMVRFLVTRLGFTTVVLEAPAAEADDVNQYLQTGTGDPARLLSRLYFWGWNVREVEETLAWIREWNATAPPGRRVQVRGIDIQHPGASIDSVIAFMGRAKPSLVADVTDRYRCLEAYRNRGSVAGRPRTEYAALAIESRRQCAEEVADALLLVRTNGAGAPGYPAALQHARLVQQFEAILAVTNATTVNRLRDSSMAENVGWLRDQAGPDARLVVWSHNDRVTRQAGAMGAALSSRYGDDYRPLGVAFGAGRFNAALQQGSTLGAVQSHAVQYVASRSLEEAFLNASAPLLLLDARRMLDGGPAAAPLRGPIAMRVIGSGFDAGAESGYFTRRLFPGDFDLLLFVRSGTASTLLPFVN